MVGSRPIQLDLPPSPPRGGGVQGVVWIQGDGVESMGGGCRSKGWGF